jgi:hypothetical protein
VLHNVIAHFKVLPDHPHAETCPFNYPALARRILQKSVPFDGQEAILSQDGDRVRFNLQILFQMLGHAENRTTPAPQARTIANVRKEFSSSRVLAFYLRRAKAVLALYQRIRDDEDIADIVDLRHHGDLVAWRDFIFEHESLARLARMVAADATLPRAVTFTVQNHYPIDEQQHRWLIMGSIVEVGNHSFRLNLRGSNPGIYNKILENRSNLIVGIPRFRVVGDTSYVNINVENLNQICRS